MRGVGLVFIAVGIIAGVYVAVLDRAAIDWSLFVPCAALGAVGVFLVQLSLHRERTSTGRLEGNIKDLDETSRLLSDGMNELVSELDAHDVYALPDLIEERFHPVLNRFADARESLMIVYDVNTYADVMSAFAGGERYLNRAWSSAAEGYIDEAHASLTRARELFNEVRERLETARGARA
jgi:hypothetical protein